MVSEQPSPDESATGLAADPLFRDFLARLNATRGQSLEASIRSVADKIRWKRPSAVVRFTVVEPTVTQSWSLDLSRKSCTVDTKPAETPDLEIITTPDVLQRVLGGELAPLEAFGQGHMRVRGSVEIARALVRNLAGV